MRKSLKLTHNHNYLMGTITFEVHPITLISPRNTLAIVYKDFLFFLLFIFYFFCIFSFVKHIINEHIRERKEIPNYVKFLTLHFFYAETYRCHFMNLIQNQYVALCICTDIVKNNYNYTVQIIYIFRRDSNYTQYQLTLFLNNTFLKYVMIFHFIYIYIYMIQNLISFRFFSFCIQ